MSKATERQARKLEGATQDLIVVDRRNFRLHLYERLPEDTEWTSKQTWPVAVGADGFNTPRGPHIINTKVKDPDWRMPDSEWVAEEDRGRIVEGGTPENPLKERWLGVTDPSGGVGIHGTGDYDSIGSAASHGCIRMLPEDVIELYDQVPIGTPVFIHD
jgi:lipoprotein-anchoring transpeptidase ErfK/SrfK